MSTVPTCCPSDETDWRSDMSAGRYLTPEPISAAAALPRSASRPVMTTAAPSCASSRAQAQPMPAVPPVTRAAWWVNSIVRSPLSCTAPLDHREGGSAVVEVSQRDTQALSAPRYPRHHRAKRDVHQGCRFRIGVALDACVVHHRPDSLRQGRQRSLYVVVRQRIQDLRL